MTKTEAREYLARIREGVAVANAALADGDPRGLLYAIQEISGSAGEIESALTNAYANGDGVAGMLVSS